jgi:hydrogenase nickel incorporation protein HypA/HybF
MHEMSLIRSLLAQVRELVKEHGGGIVRGIRVQVGPLSGVEPLLLASAWTHLRGAAALGEATLDVEQVPLEAVCRTCDNVFQPVRFCFRCPTCRGTETDVVRGDGVVLHSIVLDDAALDEAEQGAAL